MYKYIYNLLREFWGLSRELSHCHAVTLCPGNEVLRPLSVYANILISTKIVRRGKQPFIAVPLCRLPSLRYALLRKYALPCIENTVKKRAFVCSLFAKSLVLTLISPAKSFLSYR